MPPVAKMNDTDLKRRKDITIDDPQKQCEDLHVYVIIKISLTDFQTRHISSNSPNITSVISKSLEILSWSLNKFTTSFQNNLTRGQ